MLLSLRIENYALIRSLNFSPGSGFSAITGETGAGKSILLGALALILGNRADTSVLWNKEKKCIVEASFDVDQEGILKALQENDIDQDNPVLFRREILPGGKTRAFINDTPVSLVLMKTLGDRLVDIHSQHKTLTLNESKFQMEMIDSFMIEQDTLVSYKQIYATYIQSLKELEELKQEEDSLQRDASYFQFLYQELETAQLKENEQEILENELRVLEHADAIQQALKESVFRLEEEEGASLLSHLQTVINTLRKQENNHDALLELVQRLHSVQLELKDISSSLNSLEETVVVSPELQTEYTERLNLIYALESKHRVDTVEKLIDIRDQLSEKISAINSLDDRIKQLEEKVNTLSEKLINLAEKLHRLRLSSAKTIEEKILPLLGELGMPQARLQISISSLASFTPSGMDEIVFLFSANLGGELQPLSKVASGGEMSRLMLAVKAVLTTNALLPTVILDEIDTGVSGDIAGKVGKIMARMAQTMQVITISHLPQIAAQAKNHFSVYKIIEDDTTTSSLRELDKEERIQEIAKMLSGENIGSAAIENAKELLASS